MEVDPPKLLIKLISMTLEEARSRWEAQPGNLLLRFSLAQRLADNGSWEEAGEHLRACLQSRPDWLIACVLLGQAQLQLGDPAGARETLECAHRLAVEQAHEGPREEVEALLEDLVS